MSMNVTNAVNTNVMEHTDTAAAYDGYAVDREAMAAMKKAMEEASKNPQPQPDYAEKRAAFFANEKVQAFFDKMTYKPVERMEYVGGKRFNDWLDKNGLAGGAVSKMNSSEKANVYLKAYTEIYDEIERGYADGTRVKYIVDPEMEGDNKVRQMTREEEIGALDDEYAKIVNLIKWQRRDEIGGELIRQGKMEAWDAHLNSKNRPKQSISRGTYGENTPDEVKKFVDSLKDKSDKEIMREGENVFINILAQDMLHAADLFKQQYSQQEPETFDMEGFLQNVSFYKNK